MNTELIRGLQFITGRFAIVANEQISPRQHWHIPSSRAKRREPAAFMKFFRRRLDERHFARFELHHKRRSGEDQLPVIVTASFPTSPAGGNFDASQNRFIQAIDVPVMQHNAAELGLQIAIAPTLSDLKVFSALVDLVQRAAHAITGSDEDKISGLPADIMQDNRLANIVALGRVTDPRHFPQRLAGGEFMSAQPIGVEI